MALRSMPPGFRFHPTDEELVAYYLRRKTGGGRMASEVIREVELYRAEPWDLPGKSLLQTKDSEWYFFCPRDNKYLHGGRTNRSTEAGYWKATGKDRKVCTGSRTIGMKKTLVFYLGRAPHGERTDWVIHEYRLGEDFENAQGAHSYVLCRLFKKGGPGPRNGDQYGAPLMDDENHEAASGLQGESFGTSTVDQGSIALVRSAVKSDIPTAPMAEPVQEFVPGKDLNVSTQVDVHDDGDKYFEGMASKQTMENLLGSLLFSEGENEFSEQPQSEQFGMELNPEQATETVESMLMKQTLSLAEDSCIPNLEDSPPIPEAIVFGIGERVTLDSIDDILHPAANEAEMLDEMLFFAEAGQTNTKFSLDNSAWYNDYQVSELQANEGFMEGDFLELADLDSFLNALPAWPQELDCSSINQTEFFPNQVETGIQIRPQHRQPSIEDSSGLHHVQGTAMRRVRMQRNPEAGWSESAMSGIQAIETPEFQETEGAYLHVGTRSSVYTAYEQLPVSEVAVFSLSELGDLECCDDFYEFGSGVSDELQEHSVHSQTRMDKACEGCTLELSSSKQKALEFLPACLIENSENNLKQMQSGLPVFPNQVHGRQQHGVENDSGGHMQFNINATSESPPNEHLALQVLDASRSLDSATISAFDVHFNLSSVYEETLQIMHIEGDPLPMPISMQSTPESNSVESGMGLNNCCSVPLGDAVHAEDLTVVETVSRVSEILPSNAIENCVDIAVAQAEAQSGIELRQTMAILGDPPPLPPCLPGQSWSDGSIRSGCSTPSCVLSHCRHVTAAGITLSDPLDTLQQLPAVPKPLLKLLKLLGSIPTLPASAAELSADLINLPTFSPVHSTAGTVANCRRPQYKLSKSNQLQITFVEDSMPCWNRFFNSLVSVVKTGYCVCSRVKQSFGGSVFSPGNSFALLFFLGSASALLSCCLSCCVSFCLFRGFWRFGKYVVSVV